MQVKVLYIAGSLVIALIALASLPARELILTPSCEPDGVVPRLKAAVQGERFWEGQVEHLDRQIEWWVTEPERRAKLQMEVEHASKKADQVVGDIYQKHPQLRPSEQELAASALREQADTLENAEADTSFEPAQIGANQLCEE